MDSSKDTDLYSVAELERLADAVQGALYVTTGEPQLLKKVMRATETQGEDGWLYLPARVLDDLERASPGRGSVETALTETLKPLTWEDGTLLPVMFRGTMWAGVFARHGAVAHCSKDVLLALGTMALATQRQIQAARCDAGRRFVAQCFGCGTLLPDFYKAVLRLLTAWNRPSLAAVYYENEGAFRLQMASGELGSGDSLSRNLKPEIVDRWRRRKRDVGCFITVGPEPTALEFLAHAPYFAFVHQGVASAVTDYLLMVTVSGEITPAEVAGLTETAELASCLDDVQLGLTPHIDHLYSRLDHLVRSSCGTDRLLVDVFNLLRQHTGISRLVCGEIGGPARGVMTGAHDGIRVFDMPRFVMPEATLAKLRHGRGHLITDVDRMRLSSEVAAQLKQDGVRSEIYVPFRTANMTPSFLAAGSPEPGHRLGSLEQHLGRLADYLMLAGYLIAGRGATGRSAGGGSGTVGTPRTDDRFDTVSRLADGYFHDVLELLSVVLGQGEIMENVLVSNPDRVPADAVLRGVRKIDNAVDGITRFLAHLRRVCTMTTYDFQCSVFCRELLNNLPSIIHGYARQIRDTKNITLSLSIATDPLVDFPVKQERVYDLILPFLLSLMDEAVCSGRVRIFARATETEHSLAFDFAPDIIGHTTIADLLGRVFPHAELVREEAGGGSLAVGDRSVVRHQLVGNRGCRVEISERLRGGDVRLNTVQSIRHLLKKGR